MWITPFFSSSLHVFARIRLCSFKWHAYLECSANGTPKSSKWKEALPWNQFCSSFFDGAVCVLEGVCVVQRLTNIEYLLMVNHHSANFFASYWWFIHWHDIQPTESHSHTRKSLFFTKSFVSTTSNDAQCVQLVAIVCVARTLSLCV